MSEFVVREVLLSTVDTHNALIVLELSTLTKARNDMAIKIKENERRETLHSSLVN